MNKEEIIAKAPFFQGLEPDLVSQMASVALVKKYGAGSTIFHEGDPGLGFHLVAEGRVKIFKSAPDGKEQLLHLFGPGEPFGEVAIFAGRGYPAQAEAMTETATLFFPRAELKRLIAENPDLAFGIMAVLSARLRRFASMLEAVTLKEVPARLAAFVLNLAEDGRERVELSVSKGQLASLLGATPETISRALARLKNAGLISEEKPFINILDRRRLTEAASGHFEHQGQ
ncbi:transcriptional regulator [Deltaproteobacteria bacterium Smac51]|nr:transcriptional regulator [Deltaproteobacteria bacterium Smac51]